ncbi:cytochrome c family protein [Sulfuriferula multivorans]|uniref:Cytochrome c family protein n=1 Tax=Sulfuriferula multivorans TaxID=1559896 RepID=A0A401JGU7_9PROT|nr:c-type cytochrome [Sulfuriferula multivorans]GBL46812.1 cytochrome c family protein [Sulfuriferula multivorans]
MNRLLDRLTQNGKFHPMWIVLAVTGVLIVASIVFIPARYEGSKEPKQKIAVADHAAAETLPEPDAGQHESKPEPAVIQTTHFTPPAERDMPTGEMGDMIKLGRNIFVHTQVYAKNLVGNGLNCVNCHLDAGRKADSAPLWGAYVMFPAYRSKNHKVNSFEDRLAGCFRFSLNGTPPAYNSKEMLALTSYSYWLATGAPTGKELAGRGYPKLDKPPRQPDAQRGAAVFEKNCAICHGADGLGTKVNAQYAFPPLWGKDSFNAGAGMHSVKNAAAFIKANMPLGKGNSLSVQEAWDVAQFVDSHDRPPDPRVKK